MSTNYYLVNKKEREIKRRIDESIEKNIALLREGLLTTFSEVDAYIDEYDIENELSKVRHSLEDVYSYLFEDCFLSKRIGTAGGLRQVWNNNAYIEKDEEIIKLPDLSSLVDFFKENEEEYEIRSEYDEIISISDFIRMHNKS